jgi:hypothetical protein
VSHNHARAQHLTAWIGGAPDDCPDNVRVTEPEAAPREVQKHHRMVRRESGRYRRVALTAAALAIIPATIALIAAGLDALLSGGRYGVLELLTPDSTAATFTLGLVGTSEGVAIAIVVVVVVLGVQVSADRYSPRIIEIFLRDPLNVGVVALFLGSIVLTVLISLEIKSEYVPLVGVYLAVVLAVVDFTLLLPYMRHLFQFMRGDAIIASIHHTARRLITSAATSGSTRRRDELSNSVDQITDIALGSITRGDVEMGLVAIEALRQLIVDTYVPLKAQLPGHWFRVGRADMSGSSDETIADVDKAHVWLEHKILSQFVVLIGETPVFRKEIIHAIARATRETGLAGVRHKDAELVDLVVRFFNTYLRAAINQRASTFAYVLINEYRRLAAEELEGHPELALTIAAHLMAYGRSSDAAGMPFVVGAAAQDVAELVRVAAPRHPDFAQQLTHVLVRAMAEVGEAPGSAALRGLLVSCVKLALWSLEEGRTEITDALVPALRRAPPALLADTLGRMAVLRTRRFWEVSDRVDAYEYVPPAFGARLAELAELTGSARDARLERQPAR